MEGRKAGGKVRKGQGKTRSVQGTKNPQRLKERISVPKSETEVIAATNCTCRAGERLCCEEGRREPSYVQFRSIHFREFA